MKNLFATALFMGTLFMMSCNNSGNDKKQETTKSPAEKLLDEVDNAHMDGMAKMGKLSRLETQVQHLLDSINNLPGKNKSAAAGFKARLETLQNELHSAQDGMDKWMNDFKFDSAENNNELRIQYLESEKIKVEKVKTDMQNVLRMADSLLNKQPNK